MVWWKKIGLGTLVFLAWFAGLIFVGNYKSQYFWITAAIAAVACAAAPFWRRRGSTWFWPSVALCVAVNLALMYVKRDVVSDPDLPAKGIVQLMTAIDCIASWLLIVGIAYLTERRFPWSSDRSDHS